MKKLLVKSVAILMFVSIFASLQFAQVKNADKPLKGDWDFKLKELWRVDKAGEDVFARPRTMIVSDDGTVYMYDRKNMKMYMFGKDGKYTGSFGHRGEGPGEVKRFYNAFLVKDKVVVVDAFEIEYYDLKGKHLKQVKNDYTKKLPDYFMNDDEFVYFPLVITEADDLEEKISRFNLKTEKNTFIADFPVFKGGHGRRGERIIVMILPPLTPLVAAAYDNGKIYYGLNTQYEIHTVDFDGKKIGGFSVDRPKTSVTKDDRRKFVKNGPLPLPAEMVDTIANSLPEELTYFTRMVVHNKLLFVFKSYLSNALENQQIDIFSPDGKYQYRGTIKPGEDSAILAGPHALIYFKNNHVYTVEETEDGDITLVKYSVEMPKL